MRAIIYLVTYFCCRFTFVLLNELVNKETQFTFKRCINVAKFQSRFFFGNFDYYLEVHVLLNLLHMKFIYVLLQLRFCAK